jgi:hypothetical protein
LQKQFKTVEEWLGPEGDRFRGRRPMGKGFKKLWRAFQAEHAALTIPEIEAEIMKLADYQREHPQPRKGADDGVGKSAIGSGFAYRRL